MNKSILKQPEIIALKDFRLNTQSYIDKIAKGNSFIVVKRSRPAFSVGPIEEWETVVDFTEINPEGVPAENVVAALQRLDKADEQARKAAKKTRR